MSPLYSHSATRPVRALRLENPHLRNKAGAVALLNDFEHLENHLPLILLLKGRWSMTRDTMFSVVNAVRSRTDSEATMKILWCIHLGYLLRILRPMSRVSPPTYFNHQQSPLLNSAKSSPPYGSLRIASSNSASCCA